MTDPSEFDVTFSGDIAKNALNKSTKIDEKRNIWAFSSYEKVLNNIKNNISENNIKLIKGKVEETLLLKTNLPKKISLLRLDTDWYESTKIELEILFPKLSSGGVLIIDDYGSFKGAKKAVDEYFFDKFVWLHNIDDSCRLYIKK